MKKAPKEDPPLLARPETPDDFERFEAQAYEVRPSVFADWESSECPQITGMLGRLKIRP